ncbi:hypothetical protein, variant [Verruconis gallopava]|uniref:Centromere protein S n=1 Tax=Verruconis gallopava TaxID=253628 RepID=A0A0D2AIK9_9PEZI|nr:hypothetical protein, variant [Verruconis gallopava]KIW06385.1 hypothetical protein, variant [Verruconis gallopava]
MSATDPETEERLKSALWYHIGQLTDSTLLDSGSENNATPQFIGALTELVWAQIANTAKDLESFAKHAGRTQINTDDVMLLSRRNEESRPQRDL